MRTRTPLISALAATLLMSIGSVSAQTEELARPVRGSVVNGDEHGVFLKVGRGETAVGEELGICRVKTRPPPRRRRPDQHRIVLSDTGVVRIVEELEEHIFRAEVVSGRASKACAPPVEASGGRGLPPVSVAKNCFASPGLEMA